MAKGNRVELVFAGDATQLTRAFDKVGTEAKDMANTVDTNTRNMGEGFDRLTDGVDTGEQRIIGLRDAITGTGDIMRGFKEGDMTLMLTGFADLASSVVNFAGPILKGLLARLAATKVGMFAVSVATKVWAVAQGALNAVMALNPIGLVVIAIAALVALFVVAWKRSETFRNIVKAALGAVADAAGWVVDKFAALWDWIKSLASKVGGALSGFKDAFTAPFRAAFQGVKDLWNRTVGGKGFSVPDWIPGVGGKSFTIPKMHTGGVVPGAPGSETLALLQAGERVIPAGRSGGGGLTIVVQGSVMSETELFEKARRYSQRVGRLNVSAGIA